MLEPWTEAEMDWLDLTAAEREAAERIRRAGDGLYELAMPVYEGSD